MPARQYHRKSRSGCAQCKARRTKCDERKPSCEKCSKRDDRCSFNDSSVVILQSNPKPSPGSAEHAKILIPANAGSPGTLLHQIRSRSGEGNLAPGRYLWLTSIPQQEDKNGTLSLMHHCALYSSISIANDEEALPTWRHLVTRLAFKHDFLLHAILSVTSVHIARLQPSSVHTKTAIQHHSTAIKLAIPQLAAIMQENASALCVFSRVLPLYARGLAKILPSIDPIAQTCEDFKLVRGIAALGRKTWRWSDPLLSNEFLLPQASNKSASLSKETEDHLSMLSTRNHETTGDYVLLESIDEAIALLRYSFLLLQTRPNNVTISAPFAMLVSQRFIMALETREPMALTVLAHFGLLTHSLRGVMWMEGWGMQVMEAVAKHLPARWLDCIQWPLSQI